MGDHENADLSPDDALEAVEPPVGAEAGAEVEFDVAVVGAGPAGAIAACVAARRGLRVALIDRNTFPRDKTCGDGIGPGAVRVLRELGIDSVLEGRPRIASITMFGTEGERSESPVPDIRGTSTDVFVVPRLDFDEHLFRAALASGAADMTGTRYVGMSGYDDRARTIELRDASGARKSLRAHLVIGADGVYSTVRKDLVGKDGMDPEYSGIAMRAYVECPDFEGGAAGASMLFEFDRDLLPSYGWVFPVGDGTVNIGVGLPISQLRERGADLRRLLAEFADRLRERGLEIGEIRDERAHQLRALMEMPPLTFERAALIGDAASMINPVSGEGIAYAMTAAQRLVKALPADLSDGRALAAALTGFERRFRSGHRMHLLSCRLTMVMLRRSATAAVVVRALQTDPRVLGGVFSMLFGDGRLNATTALRIARHAVR
ncbi:geranylgeranyl reductase family protein [Actinospica sp. MGRD01-02]|uniref:Geranylgeranyl reductase family protein n=1 Tax=Actinospica acidithermotolerans TaxID=2828514 RepID=A0A941IIP0_9ACTN|nr:geranylgeranyl reductase family protein [Actinospica acidithermotolerans]MBR7826333.1 geranylgeranyl reductase family protein [Actinospica acidithermotolerans]